MASLTVHLTVPKARLAVFAVALYVAWGLFKLRLISEARAAAALMLMVPWVSRGFKPK